jgi:hypothetical protein
MGSVKSDPGKDEISVVFLSQKIQIYLACLFVVSGFLIFPELEIGWRR